MGGGGGEGVDHRVTFGSVKVANLCLFRALNLDMLVCVTDMPVPIMAEFSRKGDVHSQFSITKCFSCSFKND